MSNQLPAQTPTVFWGVPLERSISDLAVNALLNVAGRAGKLGYSRIALPYAAVDTARNQFTAAFLEYSTNPDDVLIMLDNDHTHPQDVLEILARHPHEIGVVGAKAFRRGEPFDPLIFVRAENNVLYSVAEWDKDEKLIEGAIVATCAIAIKRWVFTSLEEKGFKAPFWRYRYKDGSAHHGTEDVYFGELCEAAAIPHYMDLTVECPHLTPTVIDQSSWDQWKADHPEQFGDVNLAKKNA